MGEPSPALEHLKRAVAEKAAALVKKGQVVGLGTGSTTRHAIIALARRVHDEGLRITGIPTSDASGRLAREHGIRLGTLDEFPQVDITIDGADEVDGNLDLIKGGGGALLREKIVASATAFECIIVDETKMVDRLGVGFPLPVEVIPFGWVSARRFIGRMGATVTLRKTGAVPFTTDSGNYILDCKFPGIPDPKSLERDINNIPGVVENGLFLGMTHRVMVATVAGIETRGPPRAGTGG